VFAHEAARAKRDLSQPSLCEQSAPMSQVIVVKAEDDGASKLSSQLRVAGSSGRVGATTPPTGR
jgi:hypothetical protein